MVPLARADPVITAVKNSLEGPTRTGICQITPRWAARPAFLPSGPLAGLCPGKLTPLARELGLSSLRKLVDIGTHQYPDCSERW